MTVNYCERWRTLTWCPGKDSNLHGLHHWYLKPARLPIPPPGPERIGTDRCLACQLTAEPDENPLYRPSSIQYRGNSKRRFGRPQAMAANIDTLVTVFG